MTTEAHVIFSDGYSRTKVRIDPTLEPNAVLSQNPDGTHTVILDIDMPCELIPSKTPGHYHLYIDKQLAWKDYTRLLAALAAAGIIEEGWVRGALNTGTTILRRPPSDYEFEKLKKQFETGKMFPESTEGSNGNRKF